MSIGIGICTHNRPKVLEKSLANQLKYLPEGAKLVIVDDASNPPAEGATFRFSHNAGIAAAKNKCIELLMDEGCTHFFLFDDDTWTKVEGWHLPYLESGVKHLSFTFHQLASGRANGRHFLGTRNGISSYGSPCGCMLYFTREVVDKIGGFDVDYTQWGFEHVDFSNRAFNAGLTPARYLDVANSLTLFHSMDHQQEVAGSVSGVVRQLAIPANKERFAKKHRSAEKMPYMASGTGVLLSAYFNSNPDPQRGEHWPGSVEELSPLVDSCKKNGVESVVFHDCLEAGTEGVGFVSIPKQHDQAPNVHRWSVYYDWLKQNPTDQVFMVDSTDVEVLRNPFQALNPNKLYTGDEFNMVVDNFWMRKNQEPHLASLKDYRSTIRKMGRETLPNCGIVGGSYEIVMEYLGHRVAIHNEHTKGCLSSTDMAVHNYILCKHFTGRVTHGVKVNTRFKRYEYNEISFFKHK